MSQQLSEAEAFAHKLVAGICAELGVAIDPIPEARCDAAVRFAYRHCDALVEEARRRGRGEAQREVLEGSRN